MSIESLKRWHWAVLGGIAGLALSYAQLATREEGNVGVGPGKMTQIEFERELRSPPVGDMPYLTHITIYPRTQHDRVEMRRLRLTNDGPRHEPAFYVADRPYVARGQQTPPRPDYTIHDYLGDVARSHAAVKFRDAWWQAPVPHAAMWTIGGIVVIGGIWPTILGLLVGAGLGRGKDTDPEYDLDRFKPEPAPAAPAPPVTVDLYPHLRELEAELMRNFQSPVADAPAVSVGPAEVRKLNHDADETPLPAQDDEPKHYEGEFYPVARAGHEHGADEEASHEK